MKRNNLFIRRPIYFFLASSSILLAPSVREETRKREDFFTSEPFHSKGIVKYPSGNWIFNFIKRIKFLLNFRLVIIVSTNKFFFFKIFLDYHIENYSNSTNLITSSLRPPEGRPFPNGQRTAGFFAAASPREVRMRNASFLFHVTQDPWRSIIFLSPGPASNLGKGGRGEKEKKGGERRGGK